ALVVHRNGDAVLDVVGARQGPVAQGTGPDPVEVSQVIDRDREAVAEGANGPGLVEGQRALVDTDVAGAAVVGAAGVDEFARPTLDEDVGVGGGGGVQVQHRAGRHADDRGAGVVGDGRGAGADGGGVAALGHQGAGAVVVQAEAVEDDGLVAQVQ